MEKDTHLPERAMYIGAHPDDEAWTMGGTIAKMTPKVQVDLLLYTDGNGQGIGSTRMQEQEDAMKVLGMKEFYKVGEENHFEDGKLTTELYAPMAQALLGILDKAVMEGKPYTHLMTMDEKGYTGHPDHLIVNSVVQKVFGMRDELQQLSLVGMSPEERELWMKDYEPTGGYFVHIPEPSVHFKEEYTPVDISDTFKQKEDAIRAHVSQMANGGDMHIERINKLPKVEWVRTLYKNPTAATHSPENSPKQKASSWVRNLYTRTKTYLTS